MCVPQAREKELTTTVEELTKRLRKTDEKVAALVVSGSVENGVAGTASPALLTRL